MDVKKSKIVNGEYLIVIEKSSSVTVFSLEDGSVCKPTIKYLKKIAAELDIDSSGKWTTQDYGRNIIKAVEGSTGENSSSDQNNCESAEEESCGYGKTTLKQFILDCSVILFHENGDRVGDYFSWDEVSDSLKKVLNRDDLNSNICFDVNSFNEFLSDDDEDSIFEPLGYFISSRDILRAIQLSWMNEDEINENLHYRLISPDDEYLLDDMSVWELDEDSEQESKLQLFKYLNDKNICQIDFLEHNENGEAFFENLPYVVYPPTNIFYTFNSISLVESDLFNIDYYDEEDLDSYITEKYYLEWGAEEVRWGKRLGWMDAPIYSALWNYFSENKDVIEKYIAAKSK